MNLFNTLPAETRIAITVISGVVLVSALGLLIFGHNVLGYESELIHQAAEATRADMLYSHPEKH